MNHPTVTFDATAFVKDGSIVTKPKSNTPRLVFSKEAIRSLRSHTGAKPVRVRVTVEVLEGAQP